MKLEFRNSVLSNRQVIVLFLKVFIPIGVILAFFFLVIGEGFETDVVWSILALDFLVSALFVWFVEAGMDLARVAKKFWHKLNGKNRG